ncbi:aldolase [Fistulina hepatica ATCC 64428]|uniref:Aldolase n=1 Tax=Fistulina hepatica ATCC 64428 TaxID=1128425 RepID=A0A0D7A2Q3_9AGAR|nr:aldolase [Fistulina hepatica ATCC 64428]
MSSTLLSQIRAFVTIDVDSMDPAVAVRHNAVAKFCNMTSNQAIVRGQTSLGSSLELVKAAIDRVKSSYPTLTGDDQLQEIVDLVTVLLAKEVYPNLTGNVLVQTSPSTAYDTEKTIQHAKKLVRLFGENGISKERVCIKIPSTPESIVACQQLQSEGIQTLATCLFSVPQALAASQASCLYIAPYFNELPAHFQEGVWKEYADTALEHPMCPIIHSIINLYKQINSKTLVMPASIVTAKEVIALASLGPNHLTLSGSVLDQLAALPEVPAEALQAPGAPREVGANLKATDFLANNAEALKKAIAADTETTRKLKDALDIFDAQEQELKKYIQTLI